MGGLEPRDPPLNVRPAFLSNAFLSNVVRLGLLLGLSAVSLPWAVRELAGQTANSSLTLISRDSRRQLPVVSTAGQDMVALDDLAATFQASLRDDAGAITLTYRGRTVALTPEQTMASVAGRVISLPVPPTRIGGRWHVPVEFIPRALAGVYDQRLELRRASRLVIVGDLRVPRLLMRQEPAGPGARISIESLPRTASTVTQEGNRLLVRFEADALDVALPSNQIAGLIQGVQLVEPVTIAIELGARFGSFRTATQVTDAAIMLIVDLLPAQEAAPATPPTITQTDPVTLPPSSPTLPPIDALGTRFRTVTIDPGHGGDDIGVIGAKGLEEKAVTLAVARRLRAALEGRLGVRILMTRDDDRQVSIAERTALANNNKADLFISLHANGSARPTLAGAIVHTASFAEEALDPSILSPVQLPAFGGGLRDIELVPWNLAQARHRDKSETLAHLLVETFTNRVPLTPEPLAAAPFRVLQSANMPAVLIELGFLTNPEQEARLAAADFQNTLAQSILDAIIRFKGEAPEGAVQ